MPAPTLNRPVLHTVLVRPTIMHLSPPSLVFIHTPYTWQLLVPFITQAVRLLIELVLTVSAIAAVGSFPYRFFGSFPRRAGRLYLDIMEAVCGLLGTPYGTVFHTSYRQPTCTLGSAVSFLLPDDPFSAN